MNGATRGLRGKPVRALLLVLGGWVVLRAALWPSPIPLPVLPQQTQQDAGRSAVLPPIPVAETALPPPPAWQLAPVRPLPETPLSQRVERQYWQGPAATMSATASPARPVPARHVVGHNLLLVAGLSQMPLDPALLAHIQGRGPRAAQLEAQPAPAFVPVAAQRFERETAAPRRWSMDAWALWREDDDSPLLSGRPSYGRSQIGAVVRFALAPSSGQAPQAYLRASAALVGGREQEAALGISARPLPFVPVRLAGEARVRESDAGTDTRMAAFAVSEFPPLALPGSTTGEVYVQGGYVTGRYATGFIDGQARITRDLAAGERFRLSAGAGAWGGAQEGSGRLDIGPSASLGISAGGVNARVSADYRFRVAGAAQPASGPALTISAGF